MKARVTEVLKLSKEATEEVKRLYAEYEGKYYINLNLYAIPKVAEEAEKLTNKAKSSMDNAMKGWKPKENSEIGWQIHNALGIIKRKEQDNLIEVTFDREYIK